MTISQLFQIIFTLFYVAAIFPTTVLATQQKADQIDSTLPKEKASSSTTSALEKIEIRGIRGSILKSNTAKRYNNAIVDAITAEEIGKFPDKNVAESLQRITGVSLTRVQGEGERIGVRGTAPSQNRTYINGQTIASSDWWISSQPNRGFNYTLLPAEIVSSLEVSKSPEADHDEGSLGGSIDIKTLSPLATENNKFIASAQMQYSDLSKKSDPQLSLFYNTINQANDLGVLVSLTRHERNLRRDGLESWGWAERNFNKDSDGNLQETSQEAAFYNNIWSPGGGGSAIFQQHRILSSAMTTLQYQPSINWNIELNALYSNLSANNTNQNFLWQPSSVYARNGLINDYKIEENTLVYSQYSSVPTNNPTSIPFNTSMEAIWRTSDITTQLMHIDIEHHINYWHNQYQIGYTKADGGTSKDLTSQWSSNDIYSVDFRQRKNVIASYNTSANSANLWKISELRQDQKSSIDGELFAQADFNLQLNHPIIQSIKFGAKYKRHQREFYRLRSLNGSYNEMAKNLSWSLADFSADMPNNFLEHIGNTQTLKNYSFADIYKLDTAYSNLTFNQKEEKPSTFDILENTIAVYSKLSIEGESYRGNIGVRLVNTHQKSGAYQEIVEKNSIFEDYTWSTNNKNYFDILPSINLAMDWGESAIFRLSASKVMSRPEYHHLMPSTNYNVTQAQGAGGNPNLEPFRAYNFDASFEWYFNESSLFSIAAFHKDIQSFIDIHRSHETYENVKMVINRPENSSGGTIYGLEVNFQREFFYGVGVITNYTYVQGERKDPTTGLSIDIPGNSDHTVNFTGYYETPLFSSRLSYNYRTKFATGIGEQITDSYGQWDINVSINLLDNISLIFEGINITDEQNYTYERNQFSPIGIYQNGKRFYAGVRILY